MCQIKKDFVTTEHNNFLTVSSKEVALLYQIGANLLEDAISDSIPMSCNNELLLRLNYLVRMIKVVWIPKSIK